MVPFIIIYLFNWAIYVSIFWSLLRKTSSKTERSAAAKLKQHFIIALTLSLLFGLGWGVGLAATSSIPVAELSYILQTVFVLLTSFQGLWIFMMNCVRSEEARRVWQSWVHVITCHKVSLGAKKSTSGHTSGSYSNGTLGKYVKRFSKTSTTLTFHSQTRQRIMKRETDSTIIISPEATRDESFVFTPTLNPEDEGKVRDDALTSPASNPFIFIYNDNGMDAAANAVAADDQTQHSVRDIDTYRKEMEMRETGLNFRRVGYEGMLGCETISLHSVRIVENPALEDVDSESEDAKNVFDIQWVGPDEESHPSLLVERPMQMDQDVTLYASPVPHTKLPTETCPVPTDAHTELPTETCPVPTDAHTELSTETYPVPTDAHTELSTETCNDLSTIPCRVNVPVHSDTEVPIINSSTSPDIIAGNSDSRQPIKL